MQSNDIYQTITDKLIAGLEKGLIPWRKPWKSNGKFQQPKSFTSKKAYRGINSLILWLSMSQNGFQSPYFLTFNQVRKLGGQVKKGAKSELIVFWQWIVKESNEVDSKGKPSHKRFPLLKYYRVFNVEQTNGIKYEKPEAVQTVANVFTAIEQAEKFLDGFKDKPEVLQGGQASYSPSLDVIHMPNKELFEGNSEYYCTLFHELAHSTGHKDRLNRKELTEPSIFGDALYSQEELTAEISTAFICGITGISNDKLEENQQAYINGWIKQLQSDPKCIVYASAKAQKAVDYMQGKKVTEAEASEVEAEAVTV